MCIYGWPFPARSSFQRKCRNNAPYARPTQTVVPQLVHRPMPAGLPHPTRVWNETAPTNGHELPELYPPFPVRLCRRDAPHTP
eukprot:3020965-Lingulodinium_polyedra.AAC.1